LIKLKIFTFFSAIILIMKHKTNILLIILSIFTISCKDTNAVSPSQNKALNSISNSNADRGKNGYMQRSIDKIQKEDKSTKKTKESIDNETKQKEITDSVKKEKIREKKSEDKYTLQYYFDKTATYLNSKEKTTSHKEKMDKMPVIGEH